MKEINKTFISKEKDENLEDFIQQIPHERRNGALFLTTMDYQDAVKILKRMSENDEDINPAMFIPQHLIFSMTPSEAHEIITETKEDGSAFFGDFLTQIIDYIKFWTYINDSLVNELISICGFKQVERLSDGTIMIHDFKINKEQEKHFILNCKNSHDKLKRKKFLAALDVLDKFTLLNISRKNGYFDEIALFMFSLTRSLSQFCAAEAIRDGMNIKKNRIKGGKSKADRDGLKYLIKQYHDKHPKLDNLRLWEKITDNISNDKQKTPENKTILRTPSGEYEIEFRPGATDNDGHLVQTKNGDGEHPIGFEAFKKIRKIVRS